MLLVDPPRWQAHGTLYGHLVSDTSLEELHSFAHALGLAWQAFDHDHYDLARERHADAVSAGAHPVPESVLVRRLVDSGLRVRTPDRLPRAAQVVPALREHWDGLGLGAPALGRELLERWGERHRRYHDPRHLWQVLGALEQLDEQRASSSRAVRLAAWFHDVVHDGRAGHDEQASADLATRSLTRLVGRAEAAEVARLVLVTDGHSPTGDDPAGAALCDADLAVLASSPGRYDVYVRDVRSEYSHLSERDWRVGRSAVLRHLLDLRPLFRTAQGHASWESAARANLERELGRWRS